MAKQPKKSPASAAKKTAAKKPTAKKTAAKKTAAKAVKKPAAKKAVAKKPTAKTAAKKPTAKTAKKPAAKKTTAKKAQKTARVMTTLAGANPVISSPTGGTVPANTDLTVGVTTDQTNVSYMVTVTDITGTPATFVTAITVPSPVTNPFSVVIPGNKLPAGRTFRIQVQVYPPGGGGTTSSVTVNT